MDAPATQTRLYCITLLLLLAAATLGGCATRPSFKCCTTEGRRMLDEGRYAAARGLFLTAHDMAPQNVENLCNLGRCHMGLARQYADRDDRQASCREADQAIQYYHRAVQSYPGYPAAINGLNRALELRGRGDEALKAAQWASTVVGPAAERQIFLAREYAQRGDADRALLSYRQAVAMEPGNPTPHWALGRYYLTIDRREEGIEHLQQAYRLDPKRLYVADELRRLGAEVPDMSPVDLES